MASHAILGDGCAAGELRLGESSPCCATCGFWVLFEPAAIHESWDGANTMASGHISLFEQSLGNFKALPEKWVFPLPAGSRLRLKFLLGFGQH